MTTPTEKRILAADLRWHDDGNSFMCMRCGEVIQRTRANPYPPHQACAADAAARKGRKHGK